MDFIQLVNIIKREIRNLERQYQRCQGLILTEDDLKCHLFSKLKKKLPMNERTINANTKGSSLHSEVKFFDEDDQLLLKPDLCIIDPMHMSIFHSVEFEVKRTTARFKNYSSKMFEVGGSAILIELKFCRNPNGPSDIELASYKSDLDKLIRLNSIVKDRSGDRDKVYGVFALFNKTNNGKAEFESLVSTYSVIEDLHAIYATGKVDFTGMNPNQFGSGYLMIDDAIC